MLKILVQVIPVVIFLSACQSLHKLEHNVQSPTATPALMPIDPSKLELSEINYYTTYKNPFNCSLSKTKPLDDQPYWHEPENIWQRINLGAKLSQVSNSRVTAELNWYIRNPSYMERVSLRAEPYAHYIVEQVESRGIPTEIALLPIVESAFDPFAYSHGRASGLWQFIPGTARMYKLKNNWWYDGRRDLIDSTDAALSYLEHLNKLYDGDWLLSLAAYNAGQGRVNRAIRKNRSNDKPTDFWSLDLPRETRSYVPKLLALAKLVQNPKRYGTKLHSISNAAYFAVGNTGSQIDLAQAATMADIDIEELYKLNPGFNRWATDPDGPHRLLIPVSQAKLLNDKVIKLSDSERLNWHRYTVKSGDSLSLIAKRFNTGADTIRQVNGISGTMIKVNQKLMIPIASKNSLHYSYSAEQRTIQLQKKRKGEKGSKQLFHTVESGDSLWKIARKYGVSSGKLAHWNGIATRDILKLGQKLSVWVKSTLDKSKLTELSNSSNLTLTQQREAVIKRLGYTVRNGDSLAGIADKFKVKINDIIEWNSVNPKKYLQPGQRLTLYVDVMNRH